MIIPINGKYRLASDSRQWIIQQNMGIAKKDGKGRRAGEPIWKGISFHTKIDSAVGRLAELQIMESDATTLGEALSVVRNVTDGLSSIFHPVAKVEWNQEK